MKIVMQLHDDDSVVLESHTIIHTPDNLETSAMVLRALAAACKMNLLEAAAAVLIVPTTDKKDVN